MADTQRATENSLYSSQELQKLRQQGVYAILWAELASSSCHMSSVDQIKHNTTGQSTLSQLDATNTHQNFDLHMRLKALDSSGMTQSSIRYQLCQERFQASRLVIYRLVPSLRCASLSYQSYRMPCTQCMRLSRLTHATGHDTSALCSISIHSIALIT